MKFLNVMLVVVGVFALCLSCTKNDKLKYDLKIEDTLRVNIQSEPPSMDWSKSTDTTSAEIQDNIMEGLATYNFEDPELSLLPSLSTGWTATNQAKNWDFTIRKGVLWNDGVEFTAQHVVDAWERLLNPNTASEYAYFLYGLKNGRAYAQGKIKDFSKVGVKVGPKGNLLVELDKPQSYFPYLLTHHCTYPIRKDLIAKHGSKWTDPENIVTLGPYNLKKWDHDSSLWLERNEKYYGEKPAVKNVLAYIIKENSTAINMFKSGDLDIQPELPSILLGKLKEMKGYDEVGLLYLNYYGFNVKRPPMDNPKLRMAVSYAIDRKEVTDMLGGGQTPLTSWVPVGMFGYEPDRGLKFDVAKAKKLLKEAGYGKGLKPLPKLSIGFNTNENHQRIAENIQQQLKRNLGLEIEMANQEWKVFLNILKTNPPHIFRMGWVADYPDPDNFLNLMTSYSDNNHTNWGNPKFDKLIEDASSEISKDKRRAMYSQAQKILTETDVPVIPLFSGVRHVLISERVKGFSLNVMTRKHYKTVTFK